MAVRVSKTKPYGIDMGIKKGRWPSGGGNRTKDVSCYPDID